MWVQRYEKNGETLSIFTEKRFHKACGIQIECLKRDTLRVFGTYSLSPPSSLSSFSNYLPNHHNENAKHVYVHMLGFVIKVSILMMFMMNSNPVVETYSNILKYFFIIKRINC